MAKHFENLSLCTNNDAYRWVYYSMYLSDFAPPEKWREEEEEEWTEEESREKVERWEVERTQKRRTEGGTVCRGEGEEGEADAGGELWRGGMSVRWPRQWDRGSACGAAGCGTAGRGSDLDSSQEEGDAKQQQQQQHNNWSVNLKQNQKKLIKTEKCMKEYLS